ncbi:AAA family ATPase [Polyangium aurulentum]|uniref:AAA family ATPase n=1 Tax=Polyangium aurulentum TaxID=2567896 RepID=UPI0010AE545C|nr:ATP-binding protein [Polyangium aurulentum]UQA62522.1 ATP-binding protein [Polyangium aurulentum]
MIQRAAFTNFKSLRGLACEFARFTVIVGPNGSGKSSVLDGLHYLAQSTHRSVHAIMQAPWSPAALRSRGTAGEMTLELEGQFEGTDARVAMRVAFAEGQAWMATVDLQWGEQKSTVKEPYRPPHPKHPRPDLRAMDALAKVLGTARRLRLDPHKLSAASYREGDEELPRLGFDGSGLASVLADMALRMPDAFHELQAAARAVVPALERIRLQPAKVHRTERQRIQVDETEFVQPVERSVWGHQMVLDFAGAPDVLAPLASEGTLLAIGLLAALHAEPRPRILLLDDIDQALHPRAQGELVNQVRRVLEQRPELQVVATSHSPYLLDHLDAHEVLLTATGPDGSTACASLREHPDFERWKETAKAGELWSFVGEDWVLRRAGSHAA